MSDLGIFDPGGPAAHAASPAAPPSGGGGSPLGVFGGGAHVSPPSAIGPAPQASATTSKAAPPAAKKSGGGGILGSIGRAITGTMAGPSGGGIVGSLNRGLDSATNFINPIHTITHVLPQLAVAAGTDAAHLGELAIGRGPLAGAVAPSGIPGLVAPHAPLPNGETEAGGLQKELPFLGGVGHSVQQTARYGAGGVQGLAGIGAGPKGRLGRGLQHETASQFAADPFNASLNVAGTAALGAAPIAGALGGGAAAADAAATAAEGEAATAAAGVDAGTMSAEGAAAAAERASSLRAAAEAARAAPGARLGSAIGKVGEAGRSVMEAPFAPLRLAIRGGEIPPNVFVPEGGSVGGLTGFARGVAGAEDAGPIASRLAGTRIGTYAAKLADVARARAIIRGTGPEGAGVGLDELHARQGRNLQFQRDTAAAAGHNPDIVQAAVNREAGMAAGSDVAQRAVEHGVIAPEDVPRVFGDPRVQALAAGRGTPEEEAAIGRTAEVLRAQAQARQEEELAGVGRLRGPMNPEQAGTEAMPTAVARQVQPFEQAAARSARNAGLLRDKADAAAFRAAKAEPVAAGNTGMGAQEQAAGRLAGARARAAAAANDASAAEMAVARRAQTDLYAGTSPAAKLAEVQAENETARQAQTAHAEAFTEQTRPLVAQENAAIHAKRLLAGLPAEEPASTSLLGQEAPQTAKVLDAIRHAGANPTPLVQTGEEAAFLRALEEHERTAGAGHADPQTVAGVKAMRDRLRAAVADDHANISRTLDDALLAGGHVESFAGAAGRGQLGGEYDALRDLPPSLLAKIRGAGSQVAGAAARTGPDQWAQTVAHVLGLSPEASVDQVVEAVNRLYDVQRELGKARMGGQALVDYLNRMEPPRPDQPEGYHEALMTGAPADAARAMIAGGHLAGGQAPFVEPPTPPEALAVHGALTETPVRPQVVAARGEVAADLSRRVEEASAAWRQAHAEAMATRPPGPLDPAAATAEAATRSGAARALLQPQEEGVMSRAEGNAWRRVGDALQTDAEAGAGRPGFDQLRPDEQSLYRHVVGEGKLGAARNRLGEARDAVFAKIAGRGRAAGQVEGARMERANVAERLARLGERQAAKAQTTLEAERVKAPLNPANAPGRYRPTLLANAGLGAAINGAADAAEKITPGAGDDVRALAEGLHQTVQQMNAAGIDPTHFTGPGPTRSGEGAKAGETVPRRAPLASERQKVVGVLPTSVSEIRRTEDIRARQVVANLTVQRLTDKMGTVATADGVAPPGMVGFNPGSIFQRLPDAQIKAGETVLLPKPVLDTFARTLGPDLRADVTKAWDSVIRGGKDIGVAMSPSYWAAVVLADSLKALALGKGGTLETIKAIPGAVDIIANHADNPFYGQLVGRGLSTEQAALTASEQADVGGAAGARGGLLHRAAAPFWKATGYAQSVQRLSVALADVAKGASPEEAVADARRTMGVFDNLTHTEQGIRRIVPGVAFYKHITTLALSLPLDSSARMAWLGYLYNAVGPQKGPTALFNPGGVLGGLPSFAPPIRYGMEVGLGMHPTTNIAKSGGLTSPTAAGKGPAPVVAHGARALPEAGYLATQLFTPTRGLLAALQPNVPRYQTGEALKTGTPYPGGRLGGVLYGLGLSSPTPAPPKLTGGRAGGRGGRSTRKGRS